MELTFGGYVGGQWEGVFYDGHRLRGHIEKAEVKRGMVTITLSWVAYYVPGEGWANVADPTWRSQTFVLGSYAMEQRILEDGHGSEIVGVLTAHASGGTSAQFKTAEFYLPTSHHKLNPSEVEGLHL